MHLRRNASEDIPEFQVKERETVERLYRYRQCVEHLRKFLDEDAKHPRMELIVEDADKKALDRIEVATQ